MSDIFTNRHFEAQGTNLSERLEKFKWYDWLFKRNDILLEVRILEDIMEKRRKKI